MLLQIRGSIPVLWEQIVDLTYKPTMKTVDKKDTVGSECPAFCRYRMVFDNFRQCTTLANDCFVLLVIRLWWLPALPLFLFEYSP